MFPSEHCRPFTCTTEDVFYCITSWIVTDKKHFEVYSVHHFPVGWSYIYIMGLTLSLFIGVINNTRPIIVFGNLEPIATFIFWQPKTKPNKFIVFYIVPSSLNNWMDYYFLIEKEYQLVFNRISIGRMLATQLLS